MLHKHVAAALLAALIGFGASAASAADTPNRRPYVVPYQPASSYSSWTGFYAGAHLGYGWGTSRQSFAAPVFGISSISESLGGFMAGGQVGADWQLADRWVIGIVADGTWSSMRGSMTAFGLTAGDKVDMTATVRARAGYLVLPDVLVYGTGGGAYGHLNGVLTCANSLSCKTSRYGWVAGGGAEWRLYPNWSLFAEYLHYDFGHYSDAGGFSNFHTTAEVAKLGVNYRF